MFGYVIPNQTAKDKPPFLVVLITWGPVQPGSREAKPDVFKSRGGKEMAPT